MALPRRSDRASARTAARSLSMASGANLFQWHWHHFAPLTEPQNYLPILGVLSDHEGEQIDEARATVNEAVDRLGLPVGLGKRAGQAFADIFRDRLDVWRFTGSLAEPGLVEEEIQLTELGRALLKDERIFAPAMHRQALRLSFPRIPRLRYEKQIPEAIVQIEEAMAAGPGVNVARAWSLAAGCMREAGDVRGPTGEEAAKFFSGARSLHEIRSRSEALLKERGGETANLPEPSTDKKRQGREIERWLRANGALTKESDRAFSLDPEDREFVFREASLEEMIRWSRWWGLSPA